MRLSAKEWNEGVRNNELKILSPLPGPGHLIYGQIAKGRLLYKDKTYDYCIWKVFDADVYADLTEVR